MPRTALAAAILATLLAPVAAQAAQTSIGIELATEGDFERRIITYDCAAAEPVTVSYINAAPNFLALVPVEGEAEQLVFASTIAASGVRYVSGKWVWWTRGADTSLYDMTLGEDADPVLTCEELINTP